MAAIDPGRAAAIRDVRRSQEQARKRLGLAPAIVNDSVLDKALAAAERREADATIEGESVRSFAFTYPLDLERKRWARTRDIIRRVVPGPDEDPIYLEMVARQAASVEMILRQEHAGAPNARTSDLCDRVLIATVPSISPSAFAITVRNYFNVLLSAGLIDFVYQVAKAVVLSWDLTRGEAGLLSFHGKPEDMDRVLAANPRPIDHLVRTYVNYLHHGVPRVRGLAAPPREYQLPLQMLTNFNERFLLAHEYSHALLDSLGFDAPDDLPRQAEEFQADAFAFHLVAESGLVLDRVPPNISLQGAFFVLAVFETLRRAVDITRHGKVGEDAGFASHPPASLRHQFLVQLYRDKITDRDDDLSIDGALIPCRSVMHLWRKIEGPLLAHRANAKPLHPMWQ